jgi:hypothetical protein
MKAISLGLLLGLIATMSAACAELDAPLPLSMTATTLTAGWEHHFSFEWTATEQSQSSRKVAGYVYNHNGEFATSLRVLAQAIDSGGAVVGQRIAYVPGGVGGFGRAPRNPDLPATASYGSACGTTPGSRPMATARCEPAPVSV